jgi:hypothetical protein
MKVLLAGSEKLWSDGVSVSAILSIPFRAPQYVSRSRQP